MSAVRALPLGPAELLVRPAALAALAFGTGLLAAALVASISLGQTAIPPLDVLSALVGAGSETTQLIVTQFRLPRALQAALAGACLGMAGFLLQRITRNPLAAPSVLGVVDGAGLGVILFLTLMSDASNVLTVSIHWQPLAAAAGGMTLIGLAFALARTTLNQPIRLILYGVALAALAKAAMTLFMITGPIFRTSQAMLWLAGSVHTATWREVGMIAAAAAPLAVAAAALVRPLRLADLDAVSASAAGVRLTALRVAAVAIAAGLTSAAVAFVGGIGFVGLIAPHVARRLLGHGAGSGLAGSAVAGALMVVLADLAVRLLFAPIEVPAGTVTAVIGAPYLLYLLTRRSRSDG